MAWRKRNTGPIDVPVIAGRGTGAVKLWRDRETVTLDLNGITVEPGQYAINLVALPAGYGYSGAHFFIGTDPATSDIPSILGMYSGRNLAWVRTLDWKTIRPTEQLYGSYRWRTTEAMPTGGAL